MDANFESAFATGSAGVALYTHTIPAREKARADELKTAAQKSTRLAKIASDERVELAKAEAEVRAERVRADSIVNKARHTYADPAKHKYAMPSACQAASRLGVLAALGIGISAMPEFTSTFLWFAAGAFGAVEANGALCTLFKD